MKINELTKDEREFLIRVYESKLSDFDDEAQEDPIVMRIEYLKKIDSAE